MSISTVNDNKRIPTVVTFLEMKSRPAVVPPSLPKIKAAILKTEHPPVHFYRYLYDTIGREYYWVDRKKKSDEEIGALLKDPALELHVLYAEGCPAGMAELDFRDPNTAQLAYFGLLPDYVGRRLGFYFLYHAVMNCWAKPIKKLRVNTCTLDHPRALPLYQRLGFVPYTREERYIELP